MNPLVQKIRENERLFEEKFVLAADRIVGYGDRVPSFLSGNQIKSYIRSCEISILDTIEKWCEEEKGDSKEWVDMMSAAREAGFSNMKSPEDFISGRNFILTLIQNFIIEAKKKI